jgi:Tol biopolymer transport system component
MKRSFSSVVLVAFMCVVLSCSSDMTSGPIDEHSLVLAYTNQTALHCGIVLSTVTGETREIERACGFGVAWSPDGTRLAFNRAGGEAIPPTLWTVNADGSGETEVPEGGALAAPEWSPDGTRIAALNLSAGNIVILHPDGTARTTLSPIGPLGFERVSWSPDGTEVLFAHPDTLWAVNVVTSVARVVAVPGLEYMSEARWSPDGNRISVAAHAPAGTGLYVMNADGTNQHLLAEAFEVSGASWSPDGSEMVYSGAFGDGTTVDIYLVPSDGSGAPENLTSNSRGQASRGPDWARTR